MTCRGSDPDDRYRFAASELEKLRKAQQDVQWLLDRGYKMSSVIDLVGKHYQLTARQGTALRRATSTQRQYDLRKNAVLPLTAMKDGCIYIDGFNLIITLEVALSGSILIQGRDGAIRDLAGLRGTYRIVEETDLALALLFDYLTRYFVPQVTFYLDTPVSNSGRLRSKILDHAKSCKMPVAVELVPDADRVLSGSSRIVTSDSLILDSCKSWFNLARQIVDSRVPDAWVVKLD